MRKLSQKLTVAGMFAWWLGHAVVGVAKDSMDEARHRWANRKNGGQ